MKQWMQRRKVCGFGFRVPAAFVMAAAATATHAHRNPLEAANLIPQSQWQWHPAFRKYQEPTSPLLSSPLPPGLGIRRGVDTHSSIAKVKTQ